MRSIRATLLVVAAFIAALSGLLIRSDAELARSGKWPSVRKKFIAENPRCFVCGSEATQVHHLKPFHLWPELELDPTNLRSMCDCCHLKIGHLGNYQNENPDLDEHARILRTAKAKADSVRRARADKANNKGQK